MKVFEDDLENNKKTFVDEFKTAWVDMDDISALAVKLSPDSEPGTILQAAFIGHHICERFSAMDFTNFRYRGKAFNKASYDEFVRQSVISHVEEGHVFKGVPTLWDYIDENIFPIPHSKGLKRELEIINEMTKWNPQIVAKNKEAERISEVDYYYESTDNNKYVRLIIYHVKNERGIIVGADLYRVQDKR